MSHIPTCEDLHFDNKAANNGIVLDASVDLGLLVALVAAVSSAMQSAVRKLIPCAIHVGSRKVVMKLESVPR